MSETTPNPRHIVKLSTELSISAKQIVATAQLLAEGSTVPFIARYRKEATGTLDEVQITAIRDRLAQLDELDKRREAILKSLDERKLLTDALKASIDAAETMAALEDLYLPFRPKKRTRAMIAKEKGLEPLADWLLANQSAPAAALDAEAAKHIKPDAPEDLRVPDAPAALQGARDIIAEKINDDATIRAQIRQLFLTQGQITSKRIEKPSAAASSIENQNSKLENPPALPPEVLKYKDYFDWSEPLASIPSHRLLAIRRGSTEGVLLFRIAPPEDAALAILEAAYVKAAGPVADQVRAAVKDSYKRLLALSMETEARLESKKKADAAAIQVFADNLRQLLLASPLGQKTVLAIDPGFRTGCKTVVLDRQGKLLHNDVIYPDQGAHRTAEAEHTVRTLVQKYSIEAIAIGNGTASRETETFIRKLDLRAGGQEALRHKGTKALGDGVADSTSVPLSASVPQCLSASPPLPILMVNESGASIYSASEVAREEFPDHDVTVRGAVSIGRRLMDPLAELVKLDPKSIGVGQYQHDVDQDALKKSLDDIVISCVNAVGVEVNTASKQLLTYVSGLNATIADNIVKHRNEHGPFASRAALRDVPRLGPKTFEQAAGFLRVRDGENPLDASAVHPESYPIVDRMAKDLGVTVKDLLRDEALRRKIDKTKYVTDTGGGGVGLPTLTDILSELAKPGRDPRQQFEAFAFAEGIHKLEDVHPGMKLPGIVTNVTAFGAFVDIGVHQDGLVHISQLADRYVKDPNEVVKVQQRVEVTVLEVDLPRKRIALSMKKQPSTASRSDAAPARTSPTSPRTTTSTPRTSPTPPRKPKPIEPPQEGWFSQALRNAKKL